MAKVRINLPQRDLELLVFLVERQIEYVERIASPVKADSLRELLEKLKHHIPVKADDKTTAQSDPK